MRVTTRIGLSSLLLGALTACTADNMIGLDNAEDLDAGSSLDGLDLRIDVVPPDAWRAPAEADSLGPPGALPQTFEFRLGDDVELVLREAIILRGAVTAYDAAPWAFDVPGAMAPIAGAAVSVRLPGTLQSANTLTRDETDGVLGSFAMRLPPGDGYAWTVVAESPLIAPGSGVVDVIDDQTIDVELPLGVSVWGRVVDPDGAPIVGARVHGFDDAGLSTATATTDTAGWWLLRVPAGVWSFACEGRDNGRDPTLVERDLEIDPDGTSVTFAYPGLDLGTLTGRVIDASGEGVPGTTARLRAVSLDGYDGVEFNATKTVKTDEDGVFTTVLLPGSWDLELLPPDAAALGPVSLGEVTVERAAVADLADVPLPPTVAMVGVVADQEGTVLSGAVVSVTEIGFAGRAWTAVTDETGAFALSVPNVPVGVEVLPPGDRGELALARLVVADPGRELLQIGLPVGLAITGRVVFESADDPVPFAVLEVRDEAGNRWATGLTGADGRFDLRLSGP